MTFLRLEMAKKITFNHHSSFTNFHMDTPKLDNILEDKAFQKSLTYKLDLGTF